MCLGVVEQKGWIMLVGLVVRSMLCSISYAFSLRYPLETIIELLLGNREWGMGNRELEWV